VQFSATRKVLTAVPVILYVALLVPAACSRGRAPYTTVSSLVSRSRRRFLLATHFSDYDAVAFTINLLSLVVVLVPKYPAMHKVRLLGE